MLDTLTSTVPTDQIASRDCDVLVIGGGPAGTTAAALLAERGRDVVMLEKEAHPRFHIGESLLPRNLEVLERLGMREKVEAMGVHKPGAEFVSDEHDACTAFDFADSLDRTYTYSYHVKRAEFDAALFENARAKGVRAADRTRVTDITFIPGERAKVTVQRPDGSIGHYAPRFVLDASGRDTFLAGRLRIKDSNKVNNTAAVFAHFRNVAYRPGNLAGFITVHLVQDGWFWIIPLPNDIMSIGFVGNAAAFKARTGSLKDFLHERMRMSRTVAERTQNAEIVGDVTTAANYSYFAKTSVGESYMMIGDAFAFLDPIFSSGVLLAMTSGEIGADVADKWIDDRRAGMRLARVAEKRVRRAMTSLSWLVYRINTPVLRDMFMSPSNKWKMREGLVSMLAGNIYTAPKLPVIAFKIAYHFLNMMHRMGMRLHPDGDLKKA